MLTRNHTLEFRLVFMRASNRSLTVSSCWDLSDMHPVHEVRASAGVEWPDASIVGVSLGDALHEDDL